MIYYAETAAPAAGGERALPRNQNQAGRRADRSAREGGPGNSDLPGKG